MLNNQAERLERGISLLPVELQQSFRADWDRHQQMLENMPDVVDGDQDWLQALAMVWCCSDFCALAIQRFPEVFHDLLQSHDLYRPYTEIDIDQRIQSLEFEDEAGLKTALRRFRQREMLRIAWRDLAGWADLDEVLLTLSALADACVDAGLSYAYRQACEKYGQPIGSESGKAVSMVVLAMGKLGGRELNFSSDIDLIFYFEEAGETDSQSPLSNHEFFLYVSRSLISILNEPTKDGFVFRVDMRLRPNGDSGALALNFDAAELYYQTQGREWERYAMIKARPVAGDLQAGKTLLEMLRPFVYRKYIDYGVVESIRGLKKQIEGELKHKGIENNIKLGPGGIREIEFTAQAMQLIRGGRKQSLQQQSLLAVLPLLAESDGLTKTAVQELRQSYIFLRKTENRLQMMADEQTHLLPDKAGRQLRLAVAMGYADWQSFHAVLRKNMQLVHRHFSQVFVAPQREQVTEGSLASVWLQAVAIEDQQLLLQDAGYHDGAAIAQQLQALRDSSFYRSISAEGKSRLDHLLPLLISASALSNNPDTSLSRVLRVIQAIGRRSAYFALLVENPLALSQLVKLCSASDWISHWIGQHPMLLDELLAPANLYLPFHKQDLQQGLGTMIGNGADLESVMNHVREFKNSTLLRIAAADIGPGMAPELVGQKLSILAETILEQAYKTALAATVAQFGEPFCTIANKHTAPGFIVVAYGKFGGAELGYTSDLDIIFLHGGCEGESGTEGERNVALEMFFARLAQRLINFLSARTTAGSLYEIDTRLRPSGQSGLLVTTMDSFCRYQHDKAWTWEHQALIRARPVLGDEDLQQAFQQCRKDILCQRRDVDVLKKDIRDMRDKMMQQHTPSSDGLFNIKQDRGGIVDIEFMVQYWVLRWAAEYSSLIENTDNIGILEHLAESGLLPRDRAQFLVDAYRQLLSAEHHAKLLDGSSKIRRETLAAVIDGVAAIWQEVTG